MRSRVTNIYPYLKEPPLSVEEFKQILLKHLLQERGHANYLLKDADLAAINKLRDDRYDQWAWNYGRSPAFEMEKSRRFSGGQLVLKFNVKRGLIEDLKIYGDFSAGEMCKN